MKKEFWQIEENEDGVCMVFIQYIRCKIMIETANLGEAKWVQKVLNDHAVTAKVTITAP